MEKAAISKLCAVTSKELKPSLKKIIDSYEFLFEKRLPYLQELYQAIPELAQKKKDNNHTSRGAPKYRAIKDGGSKIKLCAIISGVSVLLSGSYIVVNIMFKEATSQIYPFLQDLEILSTGLPNIVTPEASLLRLLNEMANPYAQQTLPTLIPTYYNMSVKSVQNLKTVSERLRTSVEFLQNSSIASEATKNLTQNFTSDQFCRNLTVVGSSLTFLCIPGVKNLASTGFINTLERVMGLIHGVLDDLLANATLTKAKSIIIAPDLIDIFTLNFIMDLRISQLLDLEQSDVAAYSEKLIGHTTLMLLLSLIYTSCLLILLWIPTIRYLRKRVKLVRKIFFLLPTRVLQGNQAIKNFFKKW